MAERWFQGVTLGGMEKPMQSAPVDVGEKISGLLEKF